MLLGEIGELQIDLRKLSDYCLNPSHPRGRHKARVFASALRIGRPDAEWLRTELLALAGGHEASMLADDGFGERWQADVAVSRQACRAVVRTIWLRRRGEPALRLVTCWVS